MATRKTRGNAKAIVTKRIKEIVELMKDEINVDQVKERLIQLNEAFQDLQILHDAYHSLLKTKESIEDSSRYFEFVLNQVETLEENVELWCTGIEASGFARSLEIHPEDSVSNVGSAHECDRGSVTSRRSSKSSISSARARAAAKRAILEAEAAALKRMHQIEEELKLRQRKGQLMMEIEMAKARAEENSYAEVEGHEAPTRLPQDEEIKLALDAMPKSQGARENENMNIVKEASAMPREVSNSGPPEMSLTLSSLVNC